MPYVNVRITRDGTSAEKKQQIIAGVTDVLVKVLGKDPNSTFVVIDEVETDNWGHKGTSVTQLRGAAAKLAGSAAPSARAPAKAALTRAPAAKAAVAKAPAKKTPARRP